MFLSVSLWIKRIITWTFSVVGIGMFALIAWKYGVDFVIAWSIIPLGFMIMTYLAMIALRWVTGKRSWKYWANVAIGIMISAAAGTGFIFITCDPNRMLFRAAMISFVILCVLWMIDGVVWVKREWAYEQQRIAHEQNLFQKERP